ncbi:M20 family metallopeptidase [Halalkalibacter oceani]|uniref:M20/M25/M40 family metallo-hydrolase n=1 Tax=Halalkalibacter oceani TaxID=1653776 RepID=A0A9X2IQ53_9BACI|nr:M20/M25/M40 family metallo-hydrolase [Halalkalibacter oceani]MCM3715910.1 M20/M25/M40 family metallo-hydrolase [Halalkalibacter oceani]MCM3761137.1 M20/M25/M40 family metallo-hydrolase [Halalkalibacter oceani]
MTNIKQQIDVEALKELARKLVKRPSQQTEKMEYDPEIKGFIRDCLLPELKERGLTNVKLDQMGNLICRIGRPDSAKKVLFLGYAMTHPASSMNEPFAGQVVIEGGQEYLRGRGVSEQKGALAAMIAAAEYVNKNLEELDGELIFAVSLAGETGRHDAIDSIRKEIDLKADLGVVGIGTNSEICQGNKGRVDILVNVYGKSCHSSTPSLGVNAIEGAMEVVGKLREMPIKGEHPKLGKATLTSTSIKSFPDATHTIQNECRLVFDRRLLPGDDVAAIVGEVEQTIAGHEPYKVDVVQGPVTFPSEVNDDSIVYKQLSAAIKAVTNEEATAFYSNSAIDAGYLNKWDIPSVMFGPGKMEYWHTDNEILGVEELWNSAGIYAQLAYNHLRKKSSV